MGAEIKQRGGHLQAELPEYCSVPVTPRQGHTGAQTPADRAESQRRERRVPRPRDKGKGGRGIWELLGSLASGTCVLAVGADCFLQRLSGASLKEHSQLCLSVC